MARTATIQARIDPQIKKKAQKILNRLNISMSEAISIYLTQITLQKGIPFEIKIPNETTQAALEESEKGQPVNKVNDINQLFQELER